MARTALDAFKSLENDLAEVKYAAGLAAGLINHFPSYEKQADGMVSVTLRIDELEQLDFAVYEVHRRAKALNETYQALEIAEESAPAKAPARKGAAGCSIDARDRLDDGITLLKTAWLAMCGRSAEFDDFGGKDAVTDTMCRALNKLESAKQGLAG